jgi:DmsE family decaheme c-type cytochrome
MESSVKTLARALLVAAVAVAWLALAGTAQAGQKPAAQKATAGDKAGQKAAAVATGQPEGKYVGEDTCLGCHEAQKGYKESAHGRTFNARTPSATHGCESCHGPGEGHVNGSGDKSKIRTFKTVQDANQACTTCHDRSKHALWAGSQHEQRNVTCTTCHSAHAPKGPSQLKAASEIALCATCHRNITNRQTRFNHMPVREGKLSCSSCHNVHGSQNMKLLKVGTTVDEACASCHADKRGPVLWEHAPVSDSCTTCHDPHGSNNDRMLVAKQPFLCQRCHVTSRHPPTVYEGYLLGSPNTGVNGTSSNSNKIFGRSCVVCHQQIHGSNNPNGKAFLR